VDSDLTVIEQWFEQRGLPHFIAGRRAATQIWTRAIPLLVVFFLLGSLNALDLKRWSADRNISVSIAAVGIALAAWMLSNRLRSQRLFGVPDRVGKPELALFVLGPAIPALVFGRQWGSFIAAIAGGVALLGIIYLAASYGLPSMLRWGFSRLRSLAPTFGNLIVRALPLLLLFVAILFLTAEVWQFAGTLTGVPYWLVLLSFILLGGLLLATRLPGDVESIGRFDTWDDVQQAWIGNIAQIREFGHVYMGAERLSITEPLLRVCGFLAAFSGFYFTIYLVTDSTYRDEFRVDVVGEVRDAFAVRLAYLFVRSGGLVS
jgi:hypothetical protein